MSILQNAIDSISIGLEDFEDPDSRRLLSATRNIYAGIILLFKHKLVELSPSNSDEALIKQTVLPEFDSTGSVSWVGKGKKTVDVRSIKERLTSLGVEVDWVRLDRINRHRNDIEHYYSALSYEAVQQLISDSFVVINDFVFTHLEQDPKELLGDEAWCVLIEVNEVYKRERQECEGVLSELEYFSDSVKQAFLKHNCENCGSSLIYPYFPKGNASENGFECRSCGTSYSYEDIARVAVPHYFKGFRHVYSRDSIDQELIDCPGCSLFSYIYSDQICGVCGFSAVHECERCSSPIPPEEISEEVYCGWCTHMKNKLI